MAKIPAKLINEPWDQVWVRLIPFTCTVCLLLFVLSSAVMIPSLKANGQQSALSNSSKLMEPGDELGRLPNSLVIIHKSTLHNITITNVTYVPFGNVTRIK
jgi:hypothetical protein